MTVLVLTGSRGLIPRLSPRQLPDNAAQAAQNVKLTNGELVPYRRPRLASVPSKPLPALTIFSAFYAGGVAWLTWPFDVDVLRMPLFADAEARYAWTGDGEPRWALYSMATSGGGNDYPKTWYALGIPKPVTAPSVAPSGGASTNVTRSYCYTFFSQHGEESAPSPVSASTTGKIDATWAITGMDAFPSNSYSITAAAWSGGVLTFTVANTFGLRAGDQVTTSGFAPAALNGTFTVASVGAPGFTVAMASNPGSITDGVGTAARVGPWDTTGMKRRLYRTAGTNATFQLVNDDVGTSYNDTLSDAQIMGDDLLSQNFDPPLPGLRGLCVTNFGSLVAFIGNQLWMTEPYQGFAWKYSFSTDYPIVAIANSGNDIAVVTAANCYCGVGSDPSNFVLNKIDTPYPCLSKRSMFADGSGAGWTTRGGLAFMANGNVSIITEDDFTVDEWTKLNPETMFFESAFGKLFIGYVDDDGTPRMLVKNFKEQTLASLDVLAQDVYQDDATGIVYISTGDGIYELDPVDGAPMSMEIWSKQYITQKPVNFGAAKVEFDPAIDAEVAAAQQAAHDAAVAQNAAVFATGDVHGYFGGSFFGAMCYGGDSMVQVPDVPAQNIVSITVYNDDKVVTSRVVRDQEPFRLPKGIKWDHPSIKANSQCAIRRILVAETRAELGSV